MTAAGRSITLEPVSSATREQCSSLTVLRHQRRFVATVSHYLALCDSEQVWEPLAVLADDRVIGFAMWAYDPGEGSHWIGGVLIAGACQRQGMGRAAAEQLVDFLKSKPGCREIALSYHPDNVAARALYRSLGFRETAERADEHEVVARLLLSAR